MAVFIDEVTYVIDVDPEFVGVLQKVWDRWLSDSNLMLALAGSQMGLMRQHLLDYAAPTAGQRRKCSCLHCLMAQPQIISLTMTPLNASGYMRCGRGPGVLGTVRRQPEH